MNNVKLSVIVPTYNHEKYIKECIDSILAQEIDFTYEVLIGEDCSRDNTRAVLKDIEKALPENFKIYYREKNMGMGRTGNAWDLQKRAKGEYIITIEGDDFFLYNRKLKEQVEFLNKNKDYIAIAHKCKIVDEKSHAKTDEKYPDCKNEEYTFKNYLREELAGQLATLMYRREYNDAGNDFYDNYKLYDFFPGDRLKAFLLLTNGRVRCIQEEWSAYRHITSSGTSFSATVKRDTKMRNDELLFYKSIYNYSKAMGHEKAIRTTGKMYFSRLFVHAFGKNKDSSLKNYFKELISEKYVISNLLYTVKRIIKVLKIKVKERV